jgi:hypothetical protein
MLTLLSLTVVSILQPHSAQAKTIADLLNNPSNPSKKETALGESYGAHAFASSLSDEDKEIGQTIRKMTQQKKSPAQITHRVDQIKEKYRQKASPTQSFTMQLPMAR